MQGASSISAAASRAAHRASLAVAARSRSRSVHSRAYTAAATTCCPCRASRLLPGGARMASVTAQPSMLHVDGRVGGVWRRIEESILLLRRAASTQATPATDSSIPTIFTTAVHTRLGQMKARHAAVEKELNELHASSLGGNSNPQRLAQLSKELAELGEVVDLAGQLEGKRSEVSFLEQAVEDPDPEMAAMAKEDLDGAREAIAVLEQAVLRRLLPREDEGDEDRGLILEVRAGTGGDEASLFAGEVFGMYEKFARRNQWRFEVLSSSKNEFGGLKEAAAAVQGHEAYPKLKYESGVHRVQRVPVNDSRLHTSAATVAVLPEPQEVDFKLEPKDLKFDVFRASGAGGQHVNTTESAVRVTHLPTGIVVSIQDERSQHKNKDKAIKILRARVYEKEKERIEAEQASERRSQVGSGDRSERIRTYNFAQDRVTDHRISLSKHGVERMMDGELLEEFTDALKAADEAERMQRLLEGK